MGLITAGKLLLKNKKGAVGVIKEIKGGVSAVTGVKATFGKKGTEALKELRKKVLNKAKIERTQERIDTFFKKK